jgi:hypothetical protein
MKTRTLVGNVEDTAAAQVNRFVAAAKKQYEWLTGSSKATVVEQKRYVRHAEKTVASAERTISALKKKIAQAKKSLGLRVAPARRSRRKKSPRKNRRYTH